MGDRDNGPVPGIFQPAQRGEVTAVFQALQRTQCRLHLLTDSRYVADTLNRALQGRPIACIQHADLWRRILSQQKLTRVTLVKAHLSWDEAQLRNLPHAH